MPNYNRVILAGHVTRDPQLSQLPSDMSICKAGLAVSRKYKDKEDTCFIDLTLFGKSAETFNQYVRKGSAVLVEGRLQYSTWEGQDGQKRSKHEVVVDNFQFLTPKGDAAPAPARQSQRAAGPTKEDFDNAAEGFPHPDDEIPF